MVNIGELDDEEPFEASKMIRTNNVVSKHGSGVHCNAMGKEHKPCKFENKRAYKDQPIKKPAIAMAGFNFQVQNQLKKIEKY